MKELDVSKFVQIEYVLGSSENTRARLRARSTRLAAHAPLCERANDAVNGAQMVVASAPLHRRRAQLTAKLRLNELARAFLPTSTASARARAPERPRANATIAGTNFSPAHFRLHGVRAVLATVARWDITNTAPRTLPCATRFAALRPLRECFAFDAVDRARRRVARPLLR